MEFSPPVPILRILDEAKAREFYAEFLGFAFDWEHRFEPGTPLYAQISRGDCRLHLSEHHGDGIPGTFVRVTVSALDELHAELMDKKYKYNRPDIQDMPWGTREMTTYDPFGNRIIFVAALRP
jgi:catechol 2,3-dioxygenase-like lactoylglutathione lyase family enzyme